MDKEKALGLFRLTLNDALRHLNMYGQHVFLTETIAAIEKAALELHERLNGHE